MRMTEKEAIELLEHSDPVALGRLADAERQKRYGNTTTFIVDRNINYTNICVNECRFCAFFRRKEHKDAYLLSYEDIMEKVQETVRAGGTQVMIQGGLHPDLGLEYYEKMLQLIKSKYKITVHSFTATEVLHFARKEGISVRDTLKRLQAAGLDSLPGGGAEILVDRVRNRVSEKKIKTDEWLHVMECAHSIGMESTATMVIGLGETMAERIEHMEKVRRLQDKTGGFRAFITWTFQPGNTQLGGEKTSSWDYLKTLSMTRLYLDNIHHIQGSWVTQGERIGQLTQGFGADDLGSIMLEENVVRAAGTAYEMSIQKMVDIIRGAGRTAAQRDTEYNVIRRFDEKKG
jgi:cyclic dehypoxanthinyl futalosine synthase